MTAGKKNDKAPEKQNKTAASAQGKGQQAEKAASPQQKKSTTKRKSSFGLPSALILTGFIVCSVIFIPTTILFFIGMLPTVAASFVDQSKEKSWTLSVGFLNFAGCFPFWLELLTAGHTMNASLAITLQPTTIIIMYISAACGYIVVWALAGVIAKIAVERARSRMRDIEKMQAEMIERWGREVTGDIPLDALGFPLQDADKTK